MAGFGTATAPTRPYQQSIDQTKPDCYVGSNPVEVRVVDHPLAVARLTTMRDERTDNAGFRAALP